MSSTLLCETGSPIGRELSDGTKFGWSGSLRHPPVSTCPTLRLHAHMLAHLVFKTWVLRDRTQILMFAQQTLY